MTVFELFKPSVRPLEFSRMKVSGTVELKQLTHASPTHVEFPALVKSPVLFLVSMDHILEYSSNVVLETMKMPLRRPFGQIHPEVCASHFCSHSFRSRIDILLSGERCCRRRLLIFCIFRISCVATVHFRRRSR